MRLNDFLLVDFNKILRSEENALHKAGFDNLSISEAHTLAGLQALSGGKTGGGRRRRGQHELYRGAIWASPRAQ